MKVKIKNLLNFDIDKNAKILNRNNKSYKFLGPWCQNNINFYNKKNLNCINLNNWGNFKKKTSDTRFILRVYNKILKKLCIILNKVHKKNYSIKFWEILLHRWLFTWIVCLYSRWEYINKLKKNYSVKNLYIIKYNKENFIPKTTQQAHLIYKSNKNQFWSEWIFSEIFKNQFSNDSSFKIKKIKATTKKDNFNNSSKILNYKNLLLKRLSKNYFIYKTAMDKKTKLSLMKNFSYINLFSITKSIKFKLNKFKINRAKIFSENSNKKNDFLMFVNNNLINSLPKIFLENFYQLEEVYSEINWPKKPRVILTSFGQYYDEIFKYYCAITKEKNPKTKLIIMQHGYGSIFADNDFYGINLDLKICDKFLTWGKYRKNKKCLEGIIPKNFIKSKNIKSKKNLLIILYTFNSSLYRPPNGILNGNDLNYLTAKLFNIFFNNLKSNHKKNSASKILNINYFDNVKSSIKSKFPNHNFLNANKKFLQVVNDFKIVINFFVGTPFFECMAYNIPNILIFEKKIHMNFDKKFNLILEELKKTNIIFDSSEKAAVFLNENENFLDLWWNSKKVQKMRKKFSNNYCQVSKNPDNIIIPAINKE